MTILLTIVHVFVSIFLILVVLLQTGKGADVAAAFGGSSQTAFGARGASTFLSKMTTISAVVFMLTSLVLSMMSSGPSSSVLENVPATQAPPAAPPSGTAPPPPGQARPLNPAPPGASSTAPGTAAETTPGAAPAPAAPKPPASPGQGSAPSGGGH